MARFHTLKIQSIVRQTKKAISITFLVPSSLKSEFVFKSGQYVTLKTMIDGIEVRRDYSLSSSPKSGDLTVTVKEIENGLFSTYANKVLEPGHTLEVGTPNGRFIYEPQIAKKSSIVAFAAGSGITPIMSIIQTTLCANTVKIPFIISSPNYAKNKVTSSFTELVDVYPTLCEIANITPPEYIQGMSLTPVLEDPSIQLKKEVYTRYKEGEAVIDNNYSYTEFYRGKEYLGNMLYNLKTDLKQNIDISKFPVNAELVKIYSNKLKVMREYVKTDPSL